MTPKFDDIELSKTEFFVKIVLYKGYYVDSVVYYRRYMNIDFVLRWRWYFEYLAARLKVAYPREKVEILCGRIDLLTPAEYAVKKRESLLRAKRGQIKKLENTPDELDLFDIAINKKREKIERIEKEIKRLENGEKTFWVYGDYKNEIKKYLKGGEK
jgi:hypothetical protein